jgi:hypothetical protein
MARRAASASQHNLDDLVDQAVALHRRGLVRDLEVVLAFITLWLLDRVEAGRMQGAEANRIFTLLDARLTTPGGETRLSEEAQELLFESEFLHHLGEPDGPDPQRLRQLALAILDRQER